ncbi:hypothetical protein HHI36_000709 [Cryptolaemus montrouzieri]|uniref:Uncharacterized protein n=1 Tax=Cryptolaemus montrouzieri TaxID=559131 RepID=A0ABD2P5C4_9CUCU
MIPVANGMIYVFKNFEVNSFLPPVQKMLGRIQNSLQERFGNIEHSSTLFICTFLDPMFKHIAFRETSTADSLRKNITSLVAEKFAVKSANFSQIAKSSQGQDPDKRSEDAALASVWIEFDKIAAIYQPGGTHGSRAIIEVQRYVEYEVLPRQENPLKW